MNIVPVLVALVVLGAVPTASAQLTDPGMTVDWKPMVMSLDLCGARAITVLRNAGLEISGSGTSTDANGRYAYAWGRNGAYKMVIECIERQALVLFFIASDPRSSDDQRKAIKNSVYDSF